MKFSWSLISHYVFPQPHAPPLPAHHIKAPVKNKLARIPPCDTDAGPEPRTATPMPWQALSHSSPAPNYRADEATHKRLPQRTIKRVQVLLVPNPVAIRRVDDDKAGLARSVRQCQ